MKTVKVDDRNRIHITNIKEMTNIDIDEKKKVALHPNATTGLVYDPNASYDEIINSLESHMLHFKNLKESEEKKKEGGKSEENISGELEGVEG